MLVDYYNVGNVDGSIFQVAAKLNNVTYTGKCCGMNVRSDAPGSLLSWSSLRTAFLLSFITIVMTIF